MDIKNKDLTDDQLRVLRDKGTEAPYTGKYDKHFEDGRYVCANCGNVLFRSDTKYDAGCGWPSFTDSEGNAVKTQLDESHGMVRDEVVCNKCGGHLGHVFDDGPGESGKRFCINSASLDFKKEENE